MEELLIMRLEPHSATVFGHSVAIHLRVGSDLCVDQLY